MPQLLVNVNLNLGLPSLASAISVNRDVELSHGTYTPRLMVWACNLVLGA